jgi:putative sporulation protein YtxC
VELLSLEINENDSRELIKDIKIITNMDESDINIELSSTEEGSINVRYFTNDGRKNKENTEAVIGRITKLIVQYIKNESAEYLKENYFYFDEDEFESIIETIEDEIENDIKIQLIIKNKFKEVLENSRTINLNGFIKFRLKFISLYISQVVEKCIDNYLMKKEYLDFISIIRLIADTDEKEHELVNIIYKNKKLQVYDGNMKKITHIMNVEISSELDKRIIEYDESVINILLSISPKKIMVHDSKITKEDKEALNTVDIIKRIFEGKVEVCSGCKFCTDS